MKIFVIWGQDNSNIIEVDVLEVPIIKKARSMQNLGENNSDSSILSNQFENLNLDEDNSNNLNSNLYVPKN